MSDLLPKPGPWNMWQVPWNWSWLSIVRLLLLPSSVLTLMLPLSNSWVVVCVWLSYWSKDSILPWLLKSKWLLSMQVPGGILTSWSPARSQNLRMLSCLMLSANIKPFGQNQDWWKDLRRVRCKAERDCNKLLGWIWSLNSCGFTSNASLVLSLFLLVPFVKGLLRYCRCIVITLK